jgi:hypothetical protein
MAARFRKASDGFWAVWKYATLAALMLSLVLYFGLWTLYMTRLPRRPVPDQNRIVPVWMKGNDPLYGSYNEEWLWEASGKAFACSVLLFFSTVVTAEYRKEKERRAART